MRRRRTPASAPSELFGPETTKCSGSNAGFSSTSKPRARTALRAAAMSTSGWNTTRSAPVTWSASRGLILSDGSSGAADNTASPSRFGADEEATIRAASGTYCSMRMPRRSNSRRSSGPGSVGNSNKKWVARSSRGADRTGRVPAARVFRWTIDCAPACDTIRKKATTSALRIFIWEALIPLFGPSAAGCWRERGIPVVR